VGIEPHRGQACPAASPSAPHVPQEAMTKAYRTWGADSSC
jgi:hypothetical protein